MIRRIRRHSRPPQNGEPRSSACYRVGYGRPPKEHRFQLGESGNPKGRPKGAKNTSTLLRKILDSKIEVRTGGTVRKISVREAILTRFAEAALKGDTKSAGFLEINRLIINLPPRHLKSLTVSVAWPAFLLGLEPWHRIFAISYGSELSSKHASDFRSIVESPWYQRAFYKMQIARSLEDEVCTTHRGFRRATSVYGTLTGLGGDIFIIDDPQKPVDAQSDIQRNRINQWVSNTLMSRLDSKEKGIIIVVMQRVHLNDLSGYLMESGGWTVLSLPAIAEQDETIEIGDNEFHRRRAGEALHPELESLESLKELQRRIGPDVFAAQYQQSPVPPGGGMIRREWLRYYQEPPERTYRATIIQSWDTASKDGAQNDWSVCTTWLRSDDRHYLLDLTRGRYDYPSLKATAIALAQKYRPHYVLIEDASTGTALAQELKSVYFGGAVQLVPIERDKIGRLYINQAKFAAGLVLFPKEAAYMPELLAELLTFPQGKTDDQVDSISQALSHRTGYDITMRWVS